MCVFADSVVRTFSPAGEMLHFFSLGETIKAEGGVIQVGHKPQSELQRGLLTN